MQSIREYAKNNGVSYEAVRQQIVRYREDLGKHIVRTGKTQYLDDDAVAFLDSKRKENPVILMEQGREEENKQLKNENKELLQRLVAMQEHLISVQPKLALAEQAQLFLTQKEEADARYREERQITESLRDKLTASQIEAATEKAGKVAAEQRAAAAEQHAADVEQQNNRLLRRKLWERITNKEV